MHFNLEMPVIKPWLVSLYITSLLLKERGGASEPSLHRAVHPDADVQEGPKFKETTH